MATNTTPVVEAAAGGGSDVGGGRGYGQTAAVQFMLRHAPNGIEQDGSNWERWRKAVDVAVAMLDEDAHEVHYGTLTKPESTASAKEKLKFSRAEMRLYAFLSMVVGSSWESFADTAGSDIVSALEKRFGGSATVAELYAEWSKLSNDCLVHPHELAEHYEAMKLQRRRTEDMFTKYRSAQAKTTGSPAPLGKALEDDVFHMIFVMSLPESLRKIVFLHHNKERDVDTLANSLIAYLKNERLALDNPNHPTESAFAARSASSPRSSFRASPSASRFSSPRHTSGYSRTNSITPASPSPSFGRPTQRTSSNASTPWYQSADEVPGAERWGLFRSPKGMKFRAPRGTCFDCWQEGHFAKDAACPVQRREATSGEIKAKRLAEMGITVTPANAAALVSFGVEEDRASREWNVAESEYYTAGAGPLALFASPDDPESWSSPFFDHLSDESRTANPATAAVARPMARAAVVETIMPFADPGVTATDFVAKISPSSRSFLSRLKQLAPSAFARLASVLSVSPAAPLSSGSFIFDTGASIHLTDDRSTLHDYIELPIDRQVVIGGAFGGSGKAIGRGTLVADFTLPDGSISRLRIRGVFFTPGLGHKLISGYQVLEAGFKFFGDADRLDLLDPSGRLVARMPVVKERSAVIVQASWVLPVPASPVTRRPPSPVQRADALVATDVNLWHGRLGHVGEERMRRMEREDLAGGVQFAGSLLPCEACASAKIPKDPVSREASRRAAFPLQRLHSDVWGPAPAAGRRQGERYVFSIQDDRSRFIWARGMRTRDEVGPLVVDTITMLQRQQEASGRKNKVGRFRRDGALEYNSSLVNAFFRSEGIVAEPTVRYAHNQNGVVERSWRSVFEMARTWLVRSGLPRSFWTLAALSAVHVLNRLPTTSNEGGSSPYEEYFAQKPDIAHLRVWGCVAHVFADYSKINKLEPRRQRCYFVGYLETAEGDDRKGWLFYEPESKRFIEGVQVAWFEDHFVADQSPAWLEKEREALRRWDPMEGGDEDKGADLIEGVQGVQAPGEEGREHFVPLDGAPAFNFKKGLLALAAHPITPDRPILSGAALDLDLEEGQEGVERVADIEFVDDVAQFDARIVSKDPHFDTPSIREALNREDKAEWLTALAVELEAFAQRGVWDDELIELPPGARAMPLKWVLLIKRDEHGHVLKYKARLVARGDLQRPGVDFGEVFSSTIRFSTILTLLALATLHGWDIKRFDVTAAFLHGRLDERHPLYAQQVPGFVDPDRPRLVRRLRRSLYGLRQAGRKWNETFVEKLKSLGFSQSRADPSLFVRRRHGKIAIVPIHVDDGLVLGDDDLRQVIEDLSASLDDSVKEEPLTLFLGVRIRRRTDGSISLDQRHYVEKLIDRFDFNAECSKATETPASLAADLKPIQPGEVVVKERYREMLGALLYIAICTRPDISYAVSVASRFGAEPAQRHWVQLKRILRYVASTREQGLVYSPSSSSQLVGFTDADHAADPSTRRSISGWVFTLAGAAVDWQSKRQAVVSISSTEAEYYSFSSAVREALWLRSLFVDLGIPPSGPTLIRADNRSMITLANHPASHHRTKHFAVHASFSRERVANGDVQLEWMPTDELPADMLTKALASAKHRRFCEKVGLADCHLEGVCWRTVVEGSEVLMARWKDLDGEDDEEIFGGDDLGSSARLEAFPHVAH
ncbi:hypothetical protein JCM1840_007591 [Sporobolomyces johnsonii]